jgi:hypothetical protein
MKFLTVIALLFAALLAGCSSTEDYVDDVNAIQERVIDASNSVGSDVNASKNEILDSLERAKTEAETAVDDLAEVDVPADAEAGHEELVEGFEDLEKLFADVEQQLEKGGGSDAFEELRNQGARIDREIDAALDQINKDLGLE